jgi:hypothetical protein
MPKQATVDVVVHLHGHSARGPSMNLVTDKEPNSGLDLVDPADPARTGRSTPALLVLPRGHYYGGRSGRGYSFPALERPGGLGALVDDAVRRFSRLTGVRATRGRLILTAHSGGGASLMAILRHVDPDEVHTFDALYTAPGPLIAWALRRRASGRGALRVVYRPREGTAAHSRRVAGALGRPTPRFRVDETSVPHDLIPRRFGWRLLADPGASLTSPGAPAPTHAAGQGGSSLCDAIARVALEQFRRWRPGGGPAIVETSPAASRILQEYYRVGIGTTVTDAQLQSSSWQAAHPWSAVFVSYVVQTAGAGAAFHRSAAHQTYIRAARRNRLTQNTANPFWAFRATEVAPRVGDLVCASRMNSGATYDNIADARPRPAHCDVVTEVRPGRIQVIGGNVGQTVGEKWLDTLPDGRLRLTGAQARFFAVLTCRGASAAPTGTPSVPATPSRPPTAGGLAERAGRVMELLVHRYGYPVNGAAGLVGNLIAESGVMPDRIEGSAEGTPLRAPDFTGRVRDFTPDEVRLRDRSRRSGPRAPGVGIAQWTSPERRAGLFRHTFRGRQLGSAILFDLEAQVDYLVTELRRSYARVNAVLTAPGVTVDQASDAVLLRFEIPAAVIGRPVTHPDVQAVLTRRRRLAAQALQIHARRAPTGAPPR